MDNLLTLLELTDIRVIIGDRVRTRREHLNLNQADIAIEVGITSQAYGLIERGKAWPQYANLEAIAKCLGVDIEYFFAEVEAKPIKPTPEEALEVLREALATPKPAKSALIREITTILAPLNEAKVREVRDIVLKEARAANALAAGELPDEGRKKPDVSAKPRRKG